MKKLLSLGVVFLLIGMTATMLSGSQDRSGEDRSGSGGIRERFVGAWRLASLEAEARAEKFTELTLPGCLSSHATATCRSRDGTQPNPQSQAPAAPEQYSQGGYEASFGTYEIDESTLTFTIHVEGALVRTLVGKDLPRSFEFSGKQLIVKSTRPDEHWRVTWEHY